MIERDFDVPMIADLALREKQIQQNYRPIIAVHKWFARRPGTLFRGLLLSEFSGRPLREAFYESNRLAGKRIGDPFMGGGTPLLEANRIGCDVVGFDINPMSYWIVKQEIEHLNLDEYTEAAGSLREELRREIGCLYRTRCTCCGREDADVKYFIWVKTIQCQTCAAEVRLFPGYLLSTDSRHPRNVFICHSCGELTETESRTEPGSCGHCGAELSAGHTARRSRCTCHECGALAAFPQKAAGAPHHGLAAMEYYCPSCKPEHAGRFFKAPDDDDLRRVAEAEARWRKARPKYVPDDEIPSGDETNRLHRWGYTHYREMFNARQLLGLEASARRIAGVKDDRVRNALCTNLSDLLRYQNMLCRYDTTALKSLDIFSVHGFPVGLVQCESNLLGIMDPDRNTCVGSGGWANIIEKFRKAKAYCDEPFEVKHSGRRKRVVPIRGEWIGDHVNGRQTAQPRLVELHCADSASVEIPHASLDAVFTDPPYFGNVQYAELMDFCYVWLRRLVSNRTEGFGRDSTRDAQELTGNEDMGRGLEHFAEGLSAVFQRMATALKPGAPLAFTYHHNDLAAYYPIAAAVLDAGLTCSASLPCPAEMGASIHISGTGSSIIDTVFVCRSTGVVQRKLIVESPAAIADLVRSDLADLCQGGVKPSRGDVRCISYGHLIRLAIWTLHERWDKAAPVQKRLALIDAGVRALGGWSAVEALLPDGAAARRDLPLFSAHESRGECGATDDDIPF